jgi:hypothetical protein
MARVVLRISDDEFFSYTPREFYVLIDQHDIQTQHTEFLFAQIVSYQINYGFCTPKQPVTTKEFMPCFFDEHPVRQRKLKVNHQRLANEVRTAFSLVAVPTKVA